VLRFRGWKDEGTLSQAVCRCTATASAAPTGVSGGRSGDDVGGGRGKILGDERGKARRAGRCTVKRVGWEVLRG